MNKYYKRVEINAEGNSAEPVNFVGVHPLRWNRSDRTVQGNNPPDAGFVEAEAYEKEFVEWLNTHSEGKYYLKTIEELYSIWQKGGKT